MKFRLLPTDERFFELFNEAAANVADCSHRLEELLRGSADGLEKVIACETRADAIAQDILRRLNTSFVTPLDREDIHALAVEFDDVIDAMVEVAYRLDFADRDVSILPELEEQSELLVRMAEETVTMMQRLESMKGLSPHLDVLHRLESQGDLVYRTALQKIYSNDFRATMYVHYWKDLVETMEGALDALEEVSDVVEGIVLKHA
jgi:predicted phosphate transport protein (TIGR00153 family)